MGFYSRFGKRVLDLALGIPMLVASAPLMGAIAIGVRTRVGSPVLFRQQRPGKGAHPFVLVKFRTMRDMRGDDGELLPDSERMTAIGAWLRRFSLDELPQLWNVVRGEMSLVGPRPLLMEYLDRYSREEAQRHTVKPGLTGWTQVNGRNGIGWEQKFALDLEYVERLSLGMDLLILWKTLAKVVRGDGVVHPGAVAMPEFRGSMGRP